MLYAAFEDESNVYMVLERATGGDLFQRNDFASSSSRKDLEMKMAVNIVAPFLNVLSYLHGKGIIHRDIKPENILVMADDTMKIADFVSQPFCVLPLSPSLTHMYHARDLPLI